MNNTEKNVGIISKVAGPLIVAKNMKDVQMYDVVRVSDKRLIGEVIELRGDLASIKFMKKLLVLGQVSQYIIQMNHYRSN